MDYDERCGTISVAISTIIVLSVCWFAGLFQWMDGGLLQTAVTTMAVLVMILALTVVAGLTLRNLLRKKYREETDKIVRQFNATKDAAAFDEALVNMKNPPRFLDDKNMRYVSLSTALWFQEHIDEALQDLDNVHTENKKIKALAEKQRAHILGNSVADSTRLGQKGAGGKSK